MGVQMAGHQELGGCRRTGGDVWTFHITYAVST